MHGADTAAQRCAQRFAAPEPQVAAGPRAAKKVRAKSLSRDGN